MQSQTTNVADYIAEAEPARRPALERLRDIARESLPDWAEQIRYGMPYWEGEDGRAFSFASQKQYLSLYGLAKAAAARGVTMNGAAPGKGCIRFKKPEMIDFELVRSLVQDVAKGAPAEC